jgi:hypothetical protein
MLKQIGICLVVLAAASTTEADVAGVGRQASKIKYNSDYLIPAVELSQSLVIRQITLTWDRSHPEAGGSLFLNPNSCILNEFGEPTACTLIAIGQFDARLTPFKQKPEHQAYTVESRPQAGTGNYTALPLRLVTIAARGSESPRIHLLVLKRDQSIERIIELHQERRT